MALLRYLKPSNGLLDPRGSLLSIISSDVINEMNEEVEEATSHAPSKKCGPYEKFSSSEHLQIGKYASQHGATSTSHTTTHIIIWLFKNIVL